MPLPMWKAVHLSTTMVRGACTDMLCLGFIKDDAHYGWRAPLWSCLSKGPRSRCLLFRCQHVIFRVMLIKYQDFRFCKESILWHPAFWANTSPLLSRWTPFSHFHINHKFQDWNEVWMFIHKLQQFAFLGKHRSLSVIFTSNEGNFNNYRKQNMSHILLICISWVYMYIVECLLIVWIRQVVVLSMFS